MALMERVAKLIRANLNDLIDQAEDPETMLKQVLLDMQNQLRQVKTQVAMAIADQHLLAKKQKEHDDAARSWSRKAELAVAKEQEDLARAAIERSLHSRSAADSFGQQLEQQTAEVENLREALGKLQLKLSEAQTKCEVLAAQQRRTRAIGKVNQARGKMADGTAEAMLGRIQEAVGQEEALGQGSSEVLADSDDNRLAQLEKNERVERVLAELKGRR